MPVGALEAAIAEHNGEGLVFVGHQPSMGAAAAHLMGIQQFPKNVAPGSVIGLERQNGETGAPFQLLFFAAPGQAVIDAL
jgi:phosphohistidine phosphatase